MVSLSVQVLCLYYYFFAPGEQATIYKATRPVLASQYIFSKFDLLFMYNTKII